MSWSSETPVSLMARSRFRIRLVAGWLLSGLRFYALFCAFMFIGSLLGFGVLFALVMAGFGLARSPVQNALSRFFERQCDAYALRRTHNRAAYRSAFTKLARINKADADPHPLVAWLFYDHPPIRQRLALADAVLS